jgi:hypothetical protein
MAWERPSSRSWTRAHSEVAAEQAAPEFGAPLAVSSRAEGAQAAVRDQAAACGLNHRTQAAARSPESRILAPRYFLEHGSFAGQPPRVGAPGRARTAGARAASPAPPAPCYSSL